MAKVKKVVFWPDSALFHTSLLNIVVFWPLFVTFVRNYTRGRRN